MLSQTAALAVVIDGCGAHSVSFVCLVGWLFGLLVVVVIADKQFGLVLPAAVALDVITAVLQSVIVSFLLMSLVCL